MRVVWLILLLLVCPLTAHADVVEGRVEVLAPDTVRLASGEVLRLAHITFPDEKDLPADAEAQLSALRPLAVKALQELLTHTPLTLQKEAAPDRYGRLHGEIHVSDGTSVTAAMIAEGYGIVMPENEEDAIAELLVAEAAARRNRQGLWQNFYFQPVEQAQAVSRLNHMALIEGVIQNVAVVKGVTYLNFGEDWKTDFTASIPKYAKKYFKKIDLEALKGKHVRVRGWIFSYAGPQIELTSPYMLETLN